jgi:hypothetical protein
MADPRRSDRPLTIEEYFALEEASPIRTVVSLGAYLVVDRDRRLVERYWREADGGWRHVTIEEQGEVPLPCPGSAVAPTLDEIYEGVELPPLEEVLRLREEAAAYG